MGKLRVGVLAVAVVLGLAIGAGVAVNSARGDRPEVTIATLGPATPVSVPSATPTSDASEPSPKPTEAGPDGGEAESSNPSAGGERVDLTSATSVDRADLPAFNATWEPGTFNYDNTLACAYSGMQDGLVLDSTGNAGDGLVAKQGDRVEARLYWFVYSFTDAAAARAAYDTTRGPLVKCRGTHLAKDPEIWTPLRDATNIGAANVDKAERLLVFYEDDDQCHDGCSSDGWWNDQLIVLSGDRLLLASYSYVTDNCRPGSCEPTSDKQRRWRERVDQAFATVVGQATRR